MSFKPIKIGNLQVSYNHRPLIIAEIGINHSGSLDTAKKLADLAAESGADFIKSQFHIPFEEMSYAAKNVIPPHTKNPYMKLLMIVVYRLMKNINLKLILRV